MEPITRPRPDEYAPYYETYVSVAGDGDPLKLLVDQERELVALAEALPAGAELYRYAPDKWTIREVIGHITDAERVFTFRALWFARGDANPLPGFDQNDWSRTTNAADRALPELVDEFKAVRASTRALFAGLSADAMSRGGVASDNRVTVRALLFIILGHASHHLRVLRERYLAGLHSNG